MPAINLTRLKKQVNDLLAVVDDPDRFWLRFSALLHFYTNPTARALPRPGSYLPSLNAHDPLLREVERRLAPLAAASPERIQPVILRLWQEPLLEAHLLAARLLAHIPPQTANWLDILNAWLAASRDPRVRQALLTETLRPLRETAPERFITLLANWLKGNAPTPSWNHALLALQPYLQNASEDALPPVFALLEPILPAAAPPIQAQLTALLNLLYQKSPAETRYFLRHTLPQVRAPLSRRTLRRMAAALPEDLRLLVRQTLQGD